MNRSVLSLLLAGVIFTPLAFAQLPDSPQLFAPGVISGPADDLSPAFLPDGKTVVFTRSNGETSTLMIATLHGDRWETPRPVSFSGVWNDLEPALAPDGSFLIFASNRPADQKSAPLDGAWSGKSYPGAGGNLWRVARKGDGWGAPERLPSSINADNATFSPAVARDGSLYFMRPDPGTGNFHIYRSQYKDGNYATPVRQSFCRDADSEVDPAVAADESFLVYSVKTPAQSQRRLTLVLRKGSGWGEPMDLGDDINEKGANIEARLSPDAKTLYFSTNTVPPMPVPRTMQATRQMLEKMQVWANGRQNIWQVPLAPVLARARAK